MSFSVKMQPIVWRPVTLLEKEWQRCLEKTFRNFENGYLAEPIQENVFNKIAGLDSRRATLLKRSFQLGLFPLNTLKFSALLQRGLTRDPFL